MSNRERWIVYPLLFLALGFSLKARFEGDPRIECEQLACRTIFVRDADGKPRIVLGAEVTSENSTDKETPSHRHGGIIELLGDDGKSLAQITATENGGRFEAVDSQGTRRAALAHEPSGSGVYFYDSNGKWLRRSFAIRKSLFPIPPKPKPKSPEKSNDQSNATDPPKGAAETPDKQGENDGDSKTP
jgi:hypothetical protein